MKKLRGIVAVLCLLAACLCWGLASAENEVLYVANPKPEDRLHLRKEANTSSGSLGKYYNGVQVEALEFRVRDTFRGLNIPLRDVQLKKNLLIASIIRNGRLIYPHGNDAIHAGDSVIVVTTIAGLEELNDILA